MVFLSFLKNKNINKTGKRSLRFPVLLLKKVYAGLSARVFLI